MRQGRHGSRYDVTAEVTAPLVSCDGLALRLKRMIQRCAYCGEPFDGRVDALYCSDAHRQRAYRDRRQRPRLTTDTISAKVGELARLAGELSDRLGEFRSPRTRMPNPEAVLDLDIDARVVRLARGAADDMSHIGMYLARLLNERRKRDTDTSAVVDLRAVHDDSDWFRDTNW
jgi:hypothetical protein